MIWFLALAVFSAPLSASGPESLLEYLDRRTDLAAETRDGWSAEVKRTFGGAALDQGKNEGRAAAKSVLSAAIFFEVSPGKAVRAAREAYHDVERFVPPPIAVRYQILSFQGRRPTASPREMAFDFPRHFDPEIAPALARWWDDALSTGKVPAAEIAETKATLRKTRLLMRPLLLERLWSAARLQQRRPNSPRLKTIRRNLNRTYRGVGPLLERGVSFYAAYALLARELGKTPRQNPELKPPQPKIPAEPKEPSVPRDPSRISPWSSPTAAPKRFEALLRRAAQRWSGTPYLLGGTSLKGVDCSGYSRALMRKTLRVEIPRTASLQASIGVPVEQDSLRAGDLVFFDTLDRGEITHVGVYLGEGRFTHASSSRGVVEDRLDKRYFRRAFRGANRLVRPAQGRP
ncbi:MAG: C40 family peptidase [Myxococcota bacterium]